MDRDTAIRLDGYMTAMRASLDGVAYFMKSALSEEEFKSLVVYIGRAMGETCELSTHLYLQFPDITPPELLSGSLPPPPSGR